MVNKERVAALMEYLSKWDFQIFPLMPIAEEDAEYIFSVLEMYEREKAHKREYASIYRKAEAFIKRRPNSNDM